jgi:mRNA interferase YafQ
MRRVIQRKQFRKDFKRMVRRGKDGQKLFSIVEALAGKGHLPSELKPHPLTGRWSGFWECHIETDWLLVYIFTDREVLLVRTGTHADLFE